MTQEAKSTPNTFSKQNNGIWTHSTHPYHDGHVRICTIHIGQVIQDKMMNRLCSKRTEKKYKEKNRCMNNQKDIVKTLNIRADLILF